MLFSFLAKDSINDKSSKHKNSPDKNLKNRQESKKVHFREKMELSNSQWQKVNKIFLILKQAFYFFNFLT